MDALIVFVKTCHQIFCGIEIGTTAARIPQLYATFVSAVSIDVTSSLASMLYEQGKTVEARPLLQFVAMMLEKNKADPAFATCKSIECLRRLAIAAEREENYVEARHLYRRCVEMAEVVWGPDEPEVGQFLNNLASAQLGDAAHVGRDPMAAQLSAERALKINTVACGLQHPETAWSLLNLARALEKQHQLDAAQVLFERALAIYDAAPTRPDLSKVALTCFESAKLLRRQGKLSKAQFMLEQALVINQTAYGPTHQNATTTLMHLADLARQQGNLTAARQFCEKALNNYEASLGTSHPRVATTMNYLGGLLTELEDFEAALSIYERLFQYLVTTPDSSITPSFGTLAWNKNIAQTRLRQRTLGLLGTGAFAGFSLN